jgi:hypothetical protein
MALAPAIIFLAVMAIIWIYWGVEEAYTFFGIVFLFFAALSLLNVTLTKNLNYIIIALFQICGAFAFSGKYSELFYFSHRFMDLSRALLLLFLALTARLWITKKVKWRFREVLELAAVPVNETTNGFTPRPRPLGKMEYSKFELVEFAAFLLKHHIAIPYYESDRIVFVPTDWAQGFLRLYRLKHDYSGATWIAFGYDGNVTVNITHRDYLSYKDSFSFDQLCGSLGNLFVNFLELFRKGEGSRIIDKMDAVAEHPAS